jgi:two-component system chemotaxis sensor kinase CheA
MDGFEILSRIKKEKVDHAPIILLTNLGEAENVQKALDLGATTYLIKSDYQLREIVDKVNTVIETKAKN